MEVGHSFDFGFRSPGTVPASRPVVEVKSVPDCDADPFGHRSETSFTRWVPSRVVYLPRDSRGRREDPSPSWEGDRREWRTPDSVGQGVTVGSFVCDPSTGYGGDRGVGAQDGSENSPFVRL